MSLRVSLDYKDGYFKINREERNLAAIFYHVLLLDNNLKRFIDLVGCKYDIVENEMGIYFEYAFIRDLWNNIDQGNNINQGNDLKREFILDFLNPSNKEQLKKMSVFEFNKYFGVARASKEFIVSPGKWSIKFYNKNIVDNNEFLKTCKFKWCFNAKPDIVINTSHGTAICIEGKFESREGKYPSNDFEKDVFNKRCLESIGQLEIQKKIMEEILDIKTDYIFLVQKKSSTGTHKTWTWKEVFVNLDTSNCPYFIKEWLKRL